MVGAKPRDGIGPGAAAFYFAIAAGIAVVTGIHSGAEVLQGDLLNPDTYMRLDRLHDILATRTPLHVVLRDGSGDGTLLHWSHFIDTLLLLLAQPFRLFVAEAPALHLAAIVFGPISVGLAGLAAAWAMAPLTLPGWRWTAPALAGMAPSVVGYGLPGVAHHHVPLGIAAVMLAGAAGRIAAATINVGQPAILLGAWAAAALWLSPEAVPQVMLAFGAVGLAWLLRLDRPAIGSGMALAGLVFFALMAAIIAVDPPQEGYAFPEIWRVSIVYLGLAAATATAGAALWRLAALGQPVRSIAGIAAGAMPLLVWALAFPQVLRGSEGEGDGAAMTAMNAQVVEMQPVTGPVQAMVFLFGGALAVGVLIWLATSRRSMLWAYAAICVAGFEVAALLHVRFATYGAMASACCLPVAISALTRALSARAPGLLALSRVGLLAAAMLTTRADGYIEMLAPAAAGPRLAQAPASCRLRDIGRLLAPYAGAVVLSDVNDVPELLYRSEIRTVGSLYHLNVAAFMRLRAAWRSLPDGTDEVPQAIRQARIDYVLVCPTTARSVLVEDLPEQTLADRLARGAPPPWLQPVTTDKASGGVLYRVIR